MIRIQKVNNFCFTSSSASLLLLLLHAEINNASNWRVVEITKSECD